MFSASMSILSSFSPPLPSTSSLEDRRRCLGTDGGRSASSSSVSGPKERMAPARRGCRLSLRRCCRADRTEELEVADCVPRRSLRRPAGAVRGARGSA